MSGSHANTSAAAGGRIPLGVIAVPVNAAPSSSSSSQSGGGNANSAMHRNHQQHQHHHGPPRGNGNGGGGGGAGAGGGLNHASAAAALADAIPIDLPLDSAGAFALDMQAAQQALEGVDLGSLSASLEGLNLKLVSGVGGVLELPPGAVERAAELLQQQLRSHRPSPSPPAGAGGGAAGPAQQHSAAAKKKPSGGAAPANSAPPPGASSAPAHARSSSTGGKHHQSQQQQQQQQQQHASTGRASDDGVEVVERADDNDLEEIHEYADEWADSLPAYTPISDAVASELLAGLNMAGLQFQTLQNGSVALDVDLQSFQNALMQAQEHAQHQQYHESGGHGQQGAHHHHHHHHHHPNAQNKPAGGVHASAAGSGAGNSALGAAAAAGDFKSAADLLNSAFQEPSAASANLAAAAIDVASAVRASVLTTTRHTRWFNSDTHEFDGRQVRADNPFVMLAQRERLPYYQNCQHCAYGVLGHKLAHTSPGEDNICMHCSSSMARSAPPYLLKHLVTMMASNSNDSGSSSNSESVPGSGRKGQARAGQQSGRAKRGGEHDAGEEVIAPPMFHEVFGPFDLNTECLTSNLTATIGGPQVGGFPARFAAAHKRNDLTRLRAFMQFLADFASSVTTRVPSPAALADTPGGTPSSGAGNSARRKGRGGHAAASQDGSGAAAQPTQAAAPASSRFMCTRCPSVSTGSLSRRSGRNPRLAWSARPTAPTFTAGELGAHIATAHRAELTSAFNAIRSVHRQDPDLPDAPVPGAYESHMSFALSTLLNSNLFIPLGRDAAKANKLPKPVYTNVLAPNLLPSVLDGPEQQAAANASESPPGKGSSGGEAGPSLTDNEHQPLSLNHEFLRLRHTGQDGHRRRAVPQNFSAKFADRFVDLTPSVADLASKRNALISSATDTAKALAGRRLTACTGVQIVGDISSVTGKSASKQATLFSESELWILESGCYETGALLSKPLLKTSQVPPGGATADAASPVSSDGQQIPSSVHEAAKESSARSAAKPNAATPATDDGGKNDDRVRSAPAEKKAMGASSHPALKPTPEIQSKSNAEACGFSALSADARKRLESDVASDVLNAVVTDLLATLATRSRTEAEREEARLEEAARRQHSEREAQRRADEEKARKNAERKRRREQRKAEADEMATGLVDQTVNDLLAELARQVLDEIKPAPASSRGERAARKNAPKEANQPKTGNAGAKAPASGAIGRTGGNAESGLLFKVARTSGKVVSPGEIGAGTSSAKPVVSNKGGRRSSAAAGEGTSRDAGRSARGKQAGAAASAGRAPSLAEAASAAAFQPSMEAQAAAEAVMQHQLHLAAQHGGYLGGVMVPPGGHMPLGQMPMDAGMHGSAGLPPAGLAGGPPQALRGGADQPFGELHDSGDSLLREISTTVEHEMPMGANAVFAAGAVPGMAPPVRSVESTDSVDYMFSSEPIAAASPVVVDSLWGHDAGGAAAAGGQSPISSSPTGSAAPPTGGAVAGTWPDEAGHGAPPGAVGGSSILDSLWAESTGGLPMASPAVGEGGPPPPGIGAGHPIAMAPDASRNMFGIPPAGGPPVESPLLPSGLWGDLGSEVFGNSGVGAGGGGAFAPGAGAGAPAPPPSGVPGSDAGPDSLWGADPLAARASSEGIPHATDSGWEFHAQSGGVGPY